MDLFSFDPVKPFHGNFREPIKRKTTAILKRSELSSDTDITDNDDTNEKKDTTNWW